MSLDLVADVGGTKTVFALYQHDKVLVRERYPSDDKLYVTFEDLALSFLQKYDIKLQDIKRVCLAVAGPVVDNNSIITNLKWNIYGSALQTLFPNAEVKLINDLFSAAQAIVSQHATAEALYMPESSQAKLNSHKLVIAPGTGLGVALLGYNHRGVNIYESEAGHIDFAPQDEEQRLLANYLKQQAPQVSYEMVCSGIGINNITRFLLSKKNYRHNLNLSQNISSPVLRGIYNTPVSQLSLDVIGIFLNILARFISNCALTIMPQGGIYLAGGVFYALEKYLHDNPDVANNFIAQVHSNVSMQKRLKSFPIYKIKSQDLVLQGAKAHCDLVCVSGFPLSRTTVR